MHAALVVALPLFAWAGWWQLHRALAGNGLSWAYTFEWPFFGAYAIVMWWRLVHDVAADRAAAARDARPTDRACGPNEPAGDEAPDRSASAPARDTGLRSAETLAGADSELDAYNAYLAGLAEKTRRGRS